MDNIAVNSATAVARLSDRALAGGGLSAASGVRPVANGSPSRGLILIADPEAHHLQKVASDLDRCGWSVKIALCPTKLCSSAECAAPQGVVLEPYCDGRERLDYLRLVRHRYPMARIIVATAYPSFRSAVSAMRLGADDYTAKPLAATELTDMLEGRDQGVPPDASMPTLRLMEWEYINRVLALTGGNISATARMLGVERSTLQRKLRKHPPRR